MNPENTQWKITRPCTANWEQMAGDDRKRFCEQCGKHVHNVSAMTTAERVEFAEPRGERECIVYFHRADGTPMDLSFLAKLRRGFPILRLVRWSALVALLPAVLTACGGRRFTTMGAILLPCGPPPTSVTQPSEETQSSGVPTPPGEKYETIVREK